MRPVFARRFVELFQSILPAILPFSLLVGFLVLGMHVQTQLHTWIPGSVIGMLLLSAALWSGLVKASFLESTSEWLLAHLGLFFVCPGVEIINFLGLVEEHWLSLAIAIVGSSVVTLVATGAASRSAAAQEE